jgi:hypothetical protein
VSLIQDGVIALDKPTAETSVEELTEIVVEEYRRARLEAQVGTGSHAGNGASADAGSSADAVSSADASHSADASSGSDPGSAPGPPAG